MRRQRVWAGVWLLILLGLWIWIDSAAGVLPFAICLFLLLADAVCAQATRGKLRGRLECGKAAEKGEEIVGTLQLENSGYLPLPLVSGCLRYENLLTGEKGRIRFRTGLGARGKEELTWKVTSRYCGKMRMALESLNSGGLLNLFGWRETREEECFCTILPNRFPIEASLTESFVLNQESVRYSGTRRGEDPAEIYGLREYLPGDSLKHIHWKLTGKMGEWYIKELGMPIENSILLLYESPSDQDSPEVTDARMETLLSLSQALLSQDYAHQIGWYSKKDRGLRFCQVNTEDELAELTGGILELGLAGEKVSALECYLEASSRHPFSHVVYLTSQVQGEAVGLLRMQCTVQVLQCAGAKEGLDQSAGVCFSPDKKEEELCQIFI